MAAFHHRLDPITFEVLRHRLWAINDEGAATLRRVSGSPVATEVLDFNTSLMNARGDSVLIGVYIGAHAITQQFIVQKILADYLENPGVEEDDMFICSDPYAGALHQNDLTVVAPIHWEGRLVGWTGATIHLVDVGGMAKGSQACIGADSIYQEATPIPPLKLIERGRLRRDIEEDILIRGRTRDLNALDIRAEIAGCTVAKRRLKELIARYGIDTLTGAMEEIIDYTEAMLRARLRELPDGTWRHTCHLDYDDGKMSRLYPARVAMTKRHDHLLFEFDAAEQAPAVFNCGYAGTLSAVLIAVLVNLCYDIPWSPAGALRTMELRVAPGTILNPVWPAGCCKATTGAAYMTTHLTSMPLAKMLMASDRYRDHAMAMWMAGNPTQELHGVDQRGEPFGATILDGFAGGGGGRSLKDGIDTGGFTRSLSCAISNVETYEFNYPLLYVSRRQQRDSGGPGRHRGGAAVSTTYTVHGVDRIDTTVLHTFAAQQPEATGLAGGYPANTCAFVINRGSAIEAWFREGRMPNELEEVEGRVEVQPPLVITDLRRGDIYRCTTSGGGGFGDPLDREPAAVQRDVQHLLVSPDVARTIYSVAIDPETHAVDEAATATLRDEIRRRRREGMVVAKGPAPSGQVRARIRPATLVLDLVELDTGGKAYRCRCGHLLAWAHENFKEWACCLEAPVQAVGPLVNPYRIGGDRFVFRQFACPACAALVEVEIALRGAPYEWDVQIAV